MNQYSESGPSSILPELFRGFCAGILLLILLEESCSSQIFISVKQNVDRGKEYAFFVPVLLPPYIISAMSCPFFLTRCYPEFSYLSLLSA